MLSSLWTTGSRMLSSWTTANLSLAHFQSSCRCFLQMLPATLINEDLYFVLKFLTSIFDLQIIRWPENKRYIAGEWCLAGCGGVGGGGDSSSWVIMFFQPQHHSVVQTDAECIFNIEQKFVRINRFIYFQLLVILLRCYQDRTTISPKKFLHLYPFLLERGLFWIFFSNIVNL